MASLIAGSGVSAADRLSFTVFVALALHALMVLTDFIQEDPRPAQQTMEITLSRYDDVEKPKEADYLAETNQKGSGTLTEKALPTATVKALQHNVTPQKASSPVAQNIQQESKKKPVIVTKKSDLKRPSLFDRAIESKKPVKVQPRRSILERSLEIAELEANLDLQQQNYAKRPRVTRLTAASMMKAVDAEYVLHVVKKIERIGSLNFPEEAGKKLYGTPAVSISIYADGSIQDVDITQSSGNLVLDSQTIEIIRRSAPFAPFPKNVRKERDVLVLIRTFSYKPRGISSF
ncbi:MAG: protein TonB [Oleiphilaceae bacterium]